MYNLIVSEFLISLSQGLFILISGMYLYQSTGALWAFAITVGSKYLFGFVLQGFAGNATDRFGAKQVLFISGILAFSFCTIASTISPFISLYVFAIMMALCINITRPFNRISFFACIQMLGSDTEYKKINGYMSVALQIGEITGMVLAGLVLELLDTYTGFIVVNVLYGLVCIIYYFVWKSLSEDKPSSTSSEKRKEEDCLKAYLKKNIDLIYFFVLSAIGICLVAVFNLLLAPVVVRNYDGHSYWLTILSVTFAAGGLLGGFFSSLKEVLSGEAFLSIISSIILCGIIFLAFQYSLSAYFIIPIIFIFGFMVSYSNIIWSTKIQSASPIRLRGRIASAKYMSNSVMMLATIFIVSSIQNKTANNIYLWAWAYSVATLFIVMVIFFLCKMTQLQSGKMQELQIVKKE